MIQHHYNIEPGINRSIGDDESNIAPFPIVSSITSGTANTPTSRDTPLSSSPNNLLSTTHVPSDDLVVSVPDLPPSVTILQRQSGSANNTSWNHDPSTYPLARSQTPSDIPDHEYGAGRFSLSSYPAAIKLLVSNNVAGSIIGRSGQTISDLQMESVTRIKLSQSNDCYPGTQDRVCLVQGHPENVKTAINLLLTRLYALQQQQHYHHFTWQQQQQQHERANMHDPIYGGLHMDPAILAHAPTFSFGVQILVPTPCCGMIIGKGGTNVKHIVDSTGVTSVRLSPKESGCSEIPQGIVYLQQSPQQKGFETAGQMSTTSERVVSIIGPDFNSCLKCVFLVLDGMTMYPDISRYANLTTSYARSGSVTQDTFLGEQYKPAPQGPSPVSSPRHDDGSVSHRSIHQSCENFYDLDETILDHSMTSPALLSGIQSSLLSAYDSSVSNQVSGVSALLHLPQDIGSLQQQTQSKLSLLPVQNSFFHSVQQGIGDGTIMSGNISATDLLTIQMQESLRVSAPNRGPHSPFTPQIPQQTHQPLGFIAHVVIPDSLIGSILGRGGQTLNELQLLSNTRIRISQRGEYVPGTKNRVVAIRGLSAQDVTAAQYLMSQHMVLPQTAVIPPALSLDNRNSYGMDSTFPTYSPQSPDSSEDLTSNKKCHP